MEKINFENGTLISKAKVEVGGTIYDVEPAQYEGTTPLSAQNLNQIQANVESAILALEERAKKLEGIILYENEQGTTGTITLIESAEDFKDIEIFYFDSHALHKSTKVFNPDKKSVELSTFHVYSNSGTVIADTRAVKIEGNEIKNGAQDDYGTWMSWNNGIDKENRIKIYKVIGHKK